MRIRAFSRLVIDQLETYKLNDNTVVIDGQNFLYNLYERSELSFEFGADSDRYAKYVRDYLMKFKEANVKCYFILRGGHDDIERRLTKENIHGKDYRIGGDIFIKPIFMKDIYKQVLEDMGFEYVVSMKESKYECIALAQKLSCPVISFDVEISFFGVDYIPYTTDKSDDLLIYNKQTGNLNCKIFKLDSFLRKYRVNEEKLAIFIVLTDENIFPQNFFIDFLNSVNIPLQNKKRLIHLLAYLSRNNREKVLNTIFQHISKGDKELFLSNEVKMRELIRKQESGALTTPFFINKDEVEITETDPHWFEKGITLKYVSVPYINLYLHKTVIASSYIEDYKQENSLEFSLDIIKYSYDLLKNFDGTEIRLCHRLSQSKYNREPITIDYSIAKPNYDASICVFENGWKNIKQLDLFQHFILETLNIFDFSKLELAPNDARLLIIALVYFARKNSISTKNETYAIILSYVMLNVVFQKTGHNLPAEEVTESNKPLLDSITDTNFVTKGDCEIAEIAFEKFFNCSPADLFDIFDAKVLHPLVKFQHCLQQLNYLNILCGSPFNPTIYEKTYNGTFVYKIVWYLNNRNTSVETLRNMLNPAATVLAFFNGLIEIYDSIMY